MEVNITIPIPAKSTGNIMDSSLASSYHLDDHFNPGSICVITPAKLVKKKVSRRLGVLQSPQLLWFIDYLTPLSTCRVVRGRCWLTSDWMIYRWLIKNVLVLGAQQVYRFLGPTWQSTAAMLVWYTCDYLYTFSILEQVTCQCRWQITPHTRMYWIYGAW